LLGLSDGPGTGATFEITLPIADTDNPNHRLDQTT
jgi:signal transduction histidine kinase